MRSATTRRAQLRGRLGLGRNPLCRVSDRVEGIVLLLLIAAFVPLAAVAATGAANWVHSANAGAERAGASLRQVPAKLLQATPVVSAPTGTAWLWAPARWTVDGTAHVGSVPALAGLPAGSTEQIWVDSAGRVSPPPTTTGQVNARAALAAAVAPVIVALGLGLLWLVLRWFLDRRRMAAWTRAWAHVGPLWTRQR